MMDKNTTAIIFVLLVIAGVLALTVVIQSAGIAGEYFRYLKPTLRPGCDDGYDNDGDGLVDWKAVVGDEPAILTGAERSGKAAGDILSFQVVGGDPGCSSSNDLSELNPDVQCDDGVDNDGDGRIDYNADGSGDIGCTWPTDKDERNCGDGICQVGETCASCAPDCGSCDSCTDTDGGFAQFVKGNTYGLQNFTFINSTDSCVTGSILREYYCSGTTIANSNYDCAVDFSNCVDGKCVAGIR